MPVSLILCFFSLLLSFQYRDKLLAKVDSAEVKRSVGALRGKANAITADSAKFVKAPAAIDCCIQGSLKFTKEAVGALEKVYNDRKLPQYTATLPAFEAKRAAMLSVVRSTVDATKQV